MRSLQIIQAEGKDNLNYSDLKVIQSPAGWYIGTIFTDPHTKCLELGSRDTFYFCTKSQAEKAYGLLEKHYPDISAWMTECDTSNLAEGGIYRLFP